MDINEDIFKGEVNNIMSAIQRLLPRKKDLQVKFETPKSVIVRLKDVHAEAKSVFPKCFLGAKLIIMREVFDRLKVVQHYSYGKPKDPYKCFTQLIHKELEPKPTDEGLVVDASGSATATYREVLDGGYEMRLTSKIRDLVSSETEVSFEKEGNRSIGSFLLNMKDVEPNTVRMVTQWMYKVLPELSLGTEISMKPLAYPPSPDMSVSVRYDRPSIVLSGTVGQNGFQLCLYKMFTKNLRISTIMNDGVKGPPTFGVAVHKMVGSGSEFKIFVDSQRCGGFTFQKDVYFNEPQNDVRVLRLVWSSLIDRQKRVRFGFGFNLDF